MSSFDDARQWIETDLKDWGSKYAYLEITEDTDDKFNIIFYTETREYYISVSKSGMSGRGYLGCIMNNRYDRRGCDLPDGLITKELWESIFTRIIQIELRFPWSRD